MTNTTLFSINKGFITATTESGIKFSVVEAPNGYYVSADGFGTKLLKTLAAVIIYVS